MLATRFPAEIRCALIATISMAMLAGCASKPAPAPAPAPDPVEARLQEAIVKVSSLPDFTANPDRKAPEPKVGALVTVSFQGEAADLLKRIAAARGKELKVRGPQPYLPLVVHVDVQNMPMDEFLADVGFQFGQRADLVLTDNAFEIRYRGQP